MSRAIFDASPTPNFLAQKAERTLLVGQGVLNDMSAAEETEAVPIVRGRDDADGLVAAKRALSMSTIFGPGGTVISGPASSA